MGKKVSLVPHYNLFLLQRSREKISFFSLPDSYQTITKEGERGRDPSRVRSSRQAPFCSARITHRKMSAAFSQPFSQQKQQEIRKWKGKVGKAYFYLFVSSSSAPPSVSKIKSAFAATASKRGGDSGGGKIAFVTPFPPGEKGGGETVHKSLYYLEEKRERGGLSLASNA